MTETSGKFDRIPIRYEYMEALRQLSEPKGIKPEALIDMILAEWFKQLEVDLAVHQVQESIKAQAKRSARTRRR